MYASRDYWFWYEQAMERSLLAVHEHDRNLALADAQAYLDRWFEAVERELAVRAEA